MYTKIGDVAYNLLVETYSNTVFWGDALLIAEIFHRSGSKAQADTLAQKTQVVLNALARDIRFMKDWRRAYELSPSYDKDQNIGNFCRVFHCHDIADLFNEWWTGEEMEDYYANQY